MKIQEILKQPEGKTLEFKRDISSLKPILKTLVAFANQQIDEKKLESLGLLVPHPAVIEHPRTDVPANVPVSDQQRWFMKQLAAGKQISASYLAVYWSISEKTAKRDIAYLKRKGLVDFVGAPKNVFYHIVGEW